MAYRAGPPLHVRGVFYRGRPTPQVRGEGAYRGGPLPQVVGLQGRIVTSAQRRGAYRGGPTLRVLLLLLVAQLRGWEGLSVFLPRRGDATVVYLAVYSAQTVGMQ